MRPPKLAERLLAWSVPDDDRVFMLGDCEEEHAAIANARGRAAADRWYRRQVMRSLGRNFCAAHVRGGRLCEGIHL